MPKNNKNKVIKNKVNNKDNWVSATATHNYFNEPLLDWFKYNVGIKKKNINTTNTTIKHYLAEQGDQFESSVVGLLKSRLKKYKFHDVAGNLCAKDESKALETYEAMKKGIHIIISGVLHNPKNQTFGVPDLIVRSDILNHIVTTKVLEKEQFINAPKLGTHHWHYRIIDIKFMTLLLKSDGRTLLNGGLIPAYKSQLNVYNQALGHLQGYVPEQSYLLGRRWVYTKCSVKYFNNDCFDKLGVIDYADKDADYLDLTKKALEWIKLCKSKQASKWNLNKYPLPHENLYPNMSNFYDYRWREKKIEIAKNNHELTELWQVGKKNRLAGLQKGINNWKDKKCTAEALNVGGKSGIILDKIIKINNSNSKLLPNKIKSNLYEWKKKESLELFIDFEYKNAVYDSMIQLPVADTSVLIFMIGVGYMENNKWKFKHFSVKQLNDQEECKICFDFLIFIKDLCCKYNMDKVKCWHWSNAEQSVWSNVLLKYKKLQRIKNYIHWCDMLKIFQEEPIVIKGCLNFKLKNIANTMYKHGFIKTTWPDAIDGENAMITTVEANKKALKNKKSLIQIPIYKTVVKYNETDVKVLQEILSFLRTKI